MKINDLYSSIYKRTYGWWSRFKDRRAGRKLAQSGVHLDEEAPLESISFAQEILGAEQGIFRTLLKELKKLNEENERRHTETCIALDKNGISLGGAKDAAKVANAEKERAQSTFFDLAAKIGRPLKVRLSWLTRLILFILVIIEAPVNWLALQAVVKAVPWLSWIIAFLLGGVLVFAAYLLGLLAKRALVGVFPSFTGQHQPHERHRTAILCLVGIILVAAFAGFLIYEIGQIRQAYMDFLALDGQVGQSAFFSENVPKILTWEKHVPLQRDGLLLIGLNVALLFIGAFISFADHDAVAAYEESRRAVDRAEHECCQHIKEIERLNHERVELEAHVRALEGELALTHREPLARRKARARFVATRLGTFKEGYEAKAKKRAPRCLRELDLQAIEEAIATLEDIKALFLDLKHYLD